MPVTDTAHQLLDHAQALIQERGYNAFSYHDLADAVGIRTASIHYHFKTKADLGRALMERYLGQLEQRLGEAAAARTAKARLRAFIGMYRETANGGLACLCGSLATDIETLPDEIRSLVDTYLQRSEDWVRVQIDRGAAAGEFEPVAPADDLAALLVSGLQGALFLGRSRPGAKSLARVERAFWKSLGS